MGQGLSLDFLRARLRYGILAITFSLLTMKIVCWRLLDTEMKLGYGGG